MTIDFSWLITALQNIATNITNFFNSIWSSTSQIVNTGQGLFSGLANFGGWLYQGLVDAFNWIYKGLSWIADQIRGGIETFATWLYNGIVWIGSQLFNVGQWIWAGIQGFANMIVNGISYLWGVITNFFVGAWNTIWNFIVGFQNTVNTWWHDLMVGMRNKIKQSIFFTITTHIAWQGMERIPRATSVKEWIFGFGSILIAPIPAYIIASTLDAMLPTVSSVPQKVSPPLGALSFTPPTFEMIAPTPPIPTAPTELYAGMGATPQAQPMLMWEQQNLATSTTSIAEEGVTESEQSQDATQTTEVATEPIP